MTLVATSPLFEVLIWSGLTTARAKSWTNCVVGVPNSVVLISTVRFSEGSFVAKNKSTDVKNAPFSSTLNVCDNGSIPTLFLPGIVPKGEPLTLPPLPLLLLDLVFRLGLGEGEGLGLGLGLGEGEGEGLGLGLGEGEGEGLGLGLFLLKRLLILFKPDNIWFFCASNRPAGDIPKEPAFKLSPEGVPVKLAIRPGVTEYPLNPFGLLGTPVKYVPFSSVTFAFALSNALASWTVYFLYLPSHVNLFVMTYLCPPPLVWV